MATTFNDLLPLIYRIAENRDGAQTLAALADQVDLSPCYLQRLFSREVGESPARFAARLRLECAAALLLSGRMTVLDVALQTGFESGEGFTRAFTRHYGQSPGRYPDANREPVRVSDRASHRDHVRHVGPCVGLYRKPTETKREAAKFMSYQIATQSMPLTTVLYQSATVPAEQIADALGKILPAVYQFAIASGATLVGPPMARYPKMGPGMVTIEAGIAVASGASGSDEIELGEWLGGTAAVTVHTGPYDGLGDAHQAMDVWVHENGMQQSAPPTEIYLTDPGEVPDPKDWQTQVIWPVCGS